MNYILIAVVALFAIWLFFLTILYIGAIRHYKNLRLKSGQDLGDALSLILRRISSIESDHDKLTKELDIFRKELEKAISKYHLIRFNPFDDKGGDQSFALSLLNKNGDGFVLTSLHGRSGTRVYSKSVKNGKKDLYELSKEELEVINLSLKG